MKNAVALILAATTLALGSLSAKPPKADDKSAVPDPGWPRQRTNEQGRLVYYQPQVDDWKNFKDLDFRMVFALTPKGQKQIVGIIVLQAQTEPMSGRSTFSRRLTLLVLAPSLFSAGCGRSIDRAVEQAVEQIFEVDSTGTFSLRNSAGSVRIHGSDDASMKLKTIKKAWNTEQLNAIAARVSVQTKAVSIETSFPPQKTWRFSHRSGSVDYAITLPRTIRISRLELGNGDVLIEGMRGDVRADLVNGKLAARNCFGNVQLSVANGGLDLFYEKWEQRPFAVDSRIIAGNARVFLPRAASFHLLAETANGNVSNHFARPEERDSRRATRVNMSIGPAPRPEITIRATNGDIEIAAAKSE